MLKKIKISVVEKNKINELFQLRYKVYVNELSQYNKQSNLILMDDDDIKTTFITATSDNKILGFIGITSPKSPRYSIDKYLSRDNGILDFNNKLYEIRALTVSKDKRGSHLSNILMYSAFRWIQSHGGEKIIAMGRSDLLDMYFRVGMKKLNKSFKSGAVSYDLIGAKVIEISKKIENLEPLIKRIKKLVEWKLGINFYQPRECYHGGAFFDAIGNEFDDFSKIDEIISADVLDAWYPPSPLVQEIILKEIPWVMKTSPPTRAEGLVKIISRTRGIQEKSIMVGGGSSALIFLAFRKWLNSSSKVLVLDPTYGEYLHVLKNVINCKVERFFLKRNDQYKINLKKLSKKLKEGFDLFIWVNPNSPTGIHVIKNEVKDILNSASNCTRIWIDETYVEYAGENQSIELFAVNSENIIVCKSMSKVYSLSGMRVAYLCSSPHHLEELRTITPPWSISLPGQISASFALKSKEYYNKKYIETHKLREELITGLKKINIIEIIPGIANFIMFHLPKWSASASSVILNCRKNGLYLRDISSMGLGLGNKAIRMAIKDRSTNKRMLKIFEKALKEEKNKLL